MKKILLFITLMLSSQVFCQTSKEKAINLIEDILYNEYFLLEKGFDKVEINIDKSLDKLIYKETYHIDNKNIIERKYTVFLDDLYNHSIYYDTFMTDDNLYNVNVRINAKNGSVKFESIEVSEKFPVPIYDTNYVDYITFFSNKPLSKSYVDKLLESCKILFNAEEVVKAKIFKTN